MAGNVQSEMSTRIAIDTISAVGSLKGFRDAISSATSAWKANEVALKSSGDTFGSLKAKVDGLNEVIDLQKSKIAELKTRQEGLDTSTKDGVESYLKLQKQIDSATKQISSLESQQDRAKQSMTYYSSGLADLQKGYQAAASYSKSYVERLQAEGKEEEASKAKLSGLKSALSNLSEQYSKQEEELKRVASESGATSDAYLKQKTRLNETATSIAKTKSEMNELNESLNRKPTSFLSGVSSRLDSVNEKASKTSDLFWKITGAHLLATGITNALTSIRAHFSTLIDSAKEYDVDQQKLIATWTTLTGSADKAKDMQDTINNLAIKTGQATDTVNELEQGFYHLHSSKTESDELTKSMLNMSDAVGLNSQQIQAVTQDMVNGLSRGKANAGMLNQISQYFPMFREQLAKYETQVNHGKEVTVADLTTMAKQGKISSQTIETVFNQLGSGKYDKAADNMLQTMHGMERTIKSRMPALLGKIYKPIMQMKNPLIGQVSKWTTSDDTEKAFSGVGQALAMQISDIMSAFGGKKINISSSLDGLLLKLQTAIDKLGATIVAHKKDIKSFIDSFKAGSATSAKIFVDVLKDMATVAKLLLDVMAKFPKTTAAIVTTGLLASKAIKGLSLTFAGLNIIKTVAKNIKDFSLAQTAAAVKTKVLTAATKAQAIAQKSLNLVLNMNPFAKIALAIGAVILALVELYKHNAKIRAFVNGLVKSCQDFYKGSVKWFKQAWQDIVKISTSLFNQVKPIFSAGFKGIEDYTQLFHDIFTGKWSKVDSDVKNIVNDLINFWKSVFTAAYNWLDDITGGRLTDVLNWFKNVFGSISGVISGAVKGVKHAFGDIVRAVLSPFNDMLSGLEKGINWVLDEVGASKIKGAWKVDVPAYAAGTQGGVLHDQLALVNDAKGSKYREMYHTPDGQIGMFPAQRNMIVPLKAGTEILDAENSAKLAKLMGLNNYASGSIGSFFSGIWNKGKDLLEDADKIIAHPMEFLESIFTKFTGSVSSNISLASDIITNLPKTIASNAVNWVKKLFSDDVGNIKGTATPAQAKEVIEKAMGLAGVSGDNWLNGLETIAKYESGFRNVTNNWDSNAKAGHPSSGWFQMIESTFKAYAKAGYTNWTNPMDQAISAIGYIKARYGGIGNVPGIKSLARGGKYVGYANGGIVSNEGLYRLAEGNKSEYIIPTDYSKHDRAVQLLDDAKRAVTGTGLSDENSSKLDTLIEQQQQMITLFSKLLNKDQSIVLDTGALVGSTQPKYDTANYNAAQYQQRNVWG